MIEKILDKYNKIIKRSNSLNDLVEYKYIFVDHSEEYDRMRELDWEINESVNYHHNLKPANMGRFKRSTWEDALALSVQIDKIDRNILTNNERLDERKTMITDNLDKLKLIEKRINNKFIIDLKKMQEEFKLLELNNKEDKNKK